MSLDITVKVMRGGTQVPGQTSVYLQLDTMSAQEAAYYGGAGPYERFEGYALYPYDIRQTDLLVDTVNVNPKTNAKYQYRVVNIPEQFPDGHVEIVVDLVRGT